MAKKAFPKKRGKNFTVNIPEPIRGELEKVASTDIRPLGTMILILLMEALTARGCKLSA